MNDLGAIRLDETRCRFRVWAPLSEDVQVHILYPEDRLIPMQRKSAGYHQVVVENLGAGARYKYRLATGREFPDPASRHQPQGVHGVSEVIDPSFFWHDQQWFGLPIENYIIYELHVGTFTSGGTFEAVIPHLDELAETGISAVEIMPVAQFPGTRNWGYDGAFPFAVQNSYGGPTALKRLVNACHQRGLAAILDVVYNHLGPEGNYLSQFAPYFTDRYKTPWGCALNFDGAHSDEVRRFFISNALEWITDYHFDALRLDAVHAILDHSALSFLQELAESVHEQGTALNRRVYVIAESTLNDTRIIRPSELGGYGLDAQWNDDFHHSLHTLLTREREGYYADFGDFQYMAQAFSEGFVYSGRYSVYRRRRHGNSSRAIPSVKFVVFAQNHDQIGNRMLGERLGHLVSFEASKLASGVVLLSPFVPLLFMGDEYGETAPFQYFVSHSDEALIEAVRRGRKEEFASFKWSGDPPDPQSEETFKRSKLDHALKRKEPHRTLLEFHKELMHLRRTLPALRVLSKEKMEVVSFEQERVIAVRRWSGKDEALAVFNFNDREVTLVRSIPCGVWRKRLDSEDRRWMGRGSGVPDRMESGPDNATILQPHIVLLFENEIQD